MSIIEGIGDEVTILALVLILATTLLFAWFSTFVSDRTSLRNASPSGERAHGEDTRESEIRINEIDNSSGVEHIRTEIDSSSGTEGGTVISNAAQNEQEYVENANSESVSSENRTGLGETQTDARQTNRSSEHQRDSTVCESSSPNKLRSRLTGQTHLSASEECNNQNILHSTGIQNDDNHSGDATQNALDDAQSEQVSEENPSNPQGVDQSDEETPSDRPVPEGSVCIRIKYLTDRERVVCGNPMESLAEFRQRTFSEEINSGQTVRLIFNGHLLQDDSATLSDLNITQNCVIHCLLSQSVAPSDLHPDVHEADVDLGRFMVPLFTCILGFVWYLRWQYRYMFNATSTLSLVGVTSLFVLAVLASWRG